MPLHPTTRASVDPANDTGSLASLAYMLDAQPSVSDPVAFGHFVEKLESARPEEIAHPEDLDRIIRVARTSNDSKVTRSLIHLGLRLIEAHVGESHWTRSACAGIDRKTFAQHVQDDHTTLSLYANLVKTHVQTSEDTAPDNFLTQYPFTKEVKGLTDVLFAAENTRMSAGTIASWRPLEYLRQCFKNHSWFNWAVHWTVLVWVLGGSVSAAEAGGGFKKQTPVYVGREDAPKPLPQVPRGKNENTPASATKQGATPKSPITVNPSGARMSGTDANGRQWNITAGTGLSMPSADSDKAPKQRLDSVNPSLRASMTDEQWKVIIDAAVQAKLQGQDVNMVWKLAGVIAYMNEAKDLGIAFRAKIDSQGFRNFAARLGFTVWERGEIYLTAANISDMVKFVSKLATIDKTIRTRVSQQLGGIEYIYKTAENPTDLVQNIFVTLSVAHQARKELSDGRYVLRLDDGIEAGLVKRALARANKAMLETGAKFYITEYLEARIRAGVSVTVIEKELIKQLKILVGPSIGADFRLRLDPRVHAVFSGGAERGRAHGEISIEWDAAGDGSFVVGPSIGVEMTKGEKMAASVGIMMRGQTYVPTDPKAWLFGEGEWTPPYLVQEHASDTQSRYVQTKKNTLSMDRLVDFGIARDALPINPHETYEEIRVRELLIKNGIFKDILYDEKGYPVAGVLDIGRVIASIDIVAPASVSEFFGVYQGNVLVKFYSSSGRRLPAGKYSLGTNETDGENSVSELNSTEGSTKLETRSVNVNDIPHEFYLQIRNQVASGNISISDVRKMVAEYVAGDVAPEISKAEFVDGTVTTESATFAVSAKNAGGGVAHMAIVRGKKLSPGDIKAIKLEAIKAGTIGEYLPVKLDANGAGAATITGDDGMDMTVVTFVENAKGKPSNEATGNSVTLLSLSKFDGTPSCMLNANSLSGTCTATITGPDATVYVAYFAQELSDLSNVSAIKNGTGAGASTHFSTNNKTGSGTISFTQAGTYYGYAITVGPNGTPKTATPMGSLTVAATTTAPTLSSITCDADAETCAIKTDTAQTKVHVAVEWTSITFDATSDENGLSTIDYTGKLSPKEYVFVFTLTHPSIDGLVRTERKTITITENPAPTFVGDLSVSWVSTSGYVVAGQSSESGSAWIYTLESSDPGAATMTVAEIIAKGTEVKLVKNTDGKWAFESAISGKSAGTSYTTGVVLTDAKNKESESAKKISQLTHVETPENQRPSHTVSVTSTNHESVTLGLSASDDGGTPTVYYVILPSGGTKPSPEQIKAWQDANGTLVSLKWTLSGSAPSVNGLSASTGYRLVSVSWDGTQFGEIDTDDFATDAIPNSAPTHSATVTPGDSGTTATIAFSNSDPNGDTVRSYWVVLPANATAPNVAQIKAGQDASGATTSFSGNTTGASASVTGLSPETDYKKYSIGDDGSLSSAVDVDSFSTPEAAVSAAPGSLDLASGSDLGVSNGDDITSGSSLVVSASMPTNAKYLSVRVDGGAWTDLPTGNTSTTIDSSGWSDGNHTVEWAGWNPTHGRSSTTTSMTIAFEATKITGPGSFVGETPDTKAKAYTGLVLTYSKPFGSLTKLEMASSPTGPWTDVAGATLLENGNITFNATMPNAANVYFRATGTRVGGLGTQPAGGVIATAALPNSLSVTTDPGDIDLSTASDLGIDDEDNTTSAATLTLSVDSLPTNATKLQYSLNGGTDWTDVADGATSWDIAGSDLAEGNNTITVRGVNGTPTDSEPESEITINYEKTKITGPGSFVGETPDTKAKAYTGLVLTYSKPFGSLTKLEMASSPTGPWTDVAGATLLENGNIAFNATMPNAANVYFRATGTRVGGLGTQPAGGVIATAALPNSL